VFKKAALFALLFLTGAGLGAFGGWKFSSTAGARREFGSFRTNEDRDFLKTYDLMARLSLANMGSAMRLQNPKESYKRRQEYPNLTLDTLQKGRAELTDPAALTLIDAETGVTYVRLAMLEEAAGNSPASQTWMQQAQTILKQAGWKDCSETHLKELVQALNKQDSCDKPCGKP
jgi:hypothetical protein